ncbi:fibronectin type III domain-containing protein [Actinoplanes sp. ATCC 53533]|uniref:fibronectin type III domain-containing protein n=1 Tax=Actinoplanes sp. ATCC 53533 TaxID=1288362 RepID=UPI0018F7B668
MAPPLAELTAQAQTLTSAGDLAAARDVLAEGLDPADADPQRASPDLALAAALQARILIALGDPHAARTWAGFAHAAEERLHGPHDERTIAAAATHAAVLHRVGNHGRAAQLYHDLVGELTAVDGSRSARVLAAEADLATAEHAAGHCTAARDRLADAWTRHNEAHGEDSPAGIKMLARLAGMERECGQGAAALRHFSQAQELCARYLPPDHPLGRQVARLAGAEASGRHVCGRVQRSSGPAAGGPAAGVTRVPATAPGVHPVRQEPPAPGDPTGLHARTEPPIPLPLTSPAAPTRLAVTPPPRVPGFAPQRTAARPTGPGEPQEAYRPAAPSQIWPVPETTNPAQPEQTWPTSPSAEPGQARAEPATGAWSEPPPPAPAQARQPWPETIPPPQMAASAPPVEEAPGVRAVPPQAWAVEPPGPWPPDSLPPAAYPPEEYPPGPRLPAEQSAVSVVDRRLPVPVERPDRHSGRNALVLAGVLVAGIAAAAAIVVATRPNDGAGPAAAPSAGATTPASPSAPAASASVRPTNAAVAPTDVKLQDNRDSVSLTWRYPKGSEGPVLISGGRTGQEQRAFQQLPAGTTDYVVYGLNRQNNYCFSVAVVYTVDQVAESEAVCTKRK